MKQVTAMLYQQRTKPVVQGHFINVVANAAPISNMVPNMVHHIKDIKALSLYQLTIQEIALLKPMAKVDTLGSMNKLS